MKKISLLVLVFVMFIAESKIVYGNIQSADINNNSQNYYLYAVKISNGLTVDSFCSSFKITNGFDIEMVGCNVPITEEEKAWISNFNIKKSIGKNGKIKNLLIELPRKFGKPLRSIEVPVNLNLLSQARKEKMNFNKKQAILLLLDEEGVTYYCRPAKEITPWF